MTLIRFRGCRHDRPRRLPGQGTGTHSEKFNAYLPRPTILLPEPVKCLPMWPHENCVASCLAALASRSNCPRRTPTATVLLKIGTGEAASHYDQEMIVTGKVAQVTIRPTVTFLNLDKPIPIRLSRLSFSRNSGRFLATWTRFGGNQSKSGAQSKNTMTSRKSCWNRRIN